MSLIPPQTCKTFHFDHEPNSQVTVRVLELLDPDFGLYVWPSALVMAEYIYANRRQFQGSSPDSPKIVVELGAGTALPSLLLGKLSRQQTEARTTDPIVPGDATCVFATDRAGAPQILDNIRQALMENGLASVSDDGNKGDHPTVQVCELAWGDFSTSPGGLLHLLQAVENISQVRGQGGVPSPGRIDYLVGSDTFYHPPDFEPLLATVSYVIHRHNPECVFITTYQDRSAKRNIAHLLDKWDLEAQVIEWDEFGFDMDKYLLLGSTETNEGETKVQNDGAEEKGEQVRQSANPSAAVQKPHRLVKALVDYSSGSESEEDEGQEASSDQCMSTCQVETMLQQIHLSPQYMLALPSQKVNAGTPPEIDPITPTATDHRIADGGSLSSVVVILVRRKGG